MIELQLKNRDYNGYLCVLNISEDYTNKLIQLFNLNFPTIYDMDICVNKNDAISLIDTALNWMVVGKKCLKDKLTSIDVQIPVYAFEDIVKFLKSSRLEHYCESIDFVSDEDVKFIEDFSKSIKRIH